MNDNEFVFDGTENEEFIEAEADEMVELSDEAMAELAGGARTTLSNDKNDTKHYGGNFIKKTVKGVKNYGPGSELTLRNRPDGDVKYGYGWQNGETILVNRYKSTWSNGWAYCYSTKRGGAFGYVNSKYFG